MSRKIALICATFAVSTIAACSFGGPDVQFVDSSTTEFTDSLGNYSLEVHCTLLNGGDTGQVTVSAQLDGLGGAWTESETSEVQAGEERLFTFGFPEVVRQPTGLGDYTYSCTAVAS